MHASIVCDHSCSNDQPLYQRAGFLHQITAERARVADLQRRAAQAQQQVDEQRRKMGGIRAAQDGDIQVCAARPAVR